jgi:hypothetical protein
MGAPLLVLVLADNQRGVAQELSEYGLGVNLGDAASLKSAFLADNLRVLLYDQTQRARMSTVGRVAIDGGGERLLTLLSRLHEELHGDPLRLRLATPEDAGYCGSGRTIRTREQILFTKNQFLGASI